MSVVEEALVLITSMGSPPSELLGAVCPFSGEGGRREGGREEGREE